MLRPAPSVKRVETRRIRSIDTETFTKDIHESVLLTSPSGELEDLAHQFSTTLSDILDIHAPLLQRSVILRPHAPWYTDTLRAAKQERRRLERKWLKSKLVVDKEQFKQQCVQYKDLLNKAKNKFHRSQITDSEPKDLFRVVDKLSSPKPEETLPSYDCPKALADSFAQFFVDKVKKLRDSLDNNVDLPISTEIPEICSHSFSEFLTVSEEDVLKIIMSASITSCRLDPLPASLLKLCLHDLLSTITTIVNESLSTGVVPSSFKHACIHPLLKKPGLDRDVYANYRPISNLPYLGKVIERVAVLQLQSYLTDNHLHFRIQSAYRRHHSTETALLRVQNDILSALDQRQEAFLVLLDFSAAFDTIDHGLLFRRLATRYGIQDTALSWIQSYMSGRTQSVSIKNVLSDALPLIYGVPQGSVAGPLLFTLYSAPLHDLIQSHGVSSIVYADDTQLYLTFNPEDRESAIKKIETCIADIRFWCSTNKLVLNDKKTEFIHFSSQFSKSPAVQSQLSIGETVIQSSPRARNLGAVMDSSLRMTNHVDNLCRSAMCAIRKIGQIRQYLDNNTTCRLVHAFVTSRLDSVNSLLYGLSQSEIAKIQRVQNTAARLVLCASRREHITPLLCQLHWLPVEYRSMFKILLLTYKAMNEMAPAFICDLVNLYVPTRPLRSSCATRLQLARSNTKFYGDRSFVVAAATLWNRLPADVRQATSLPMFKSRLKTHLFRQCFHV
ncbi:uncharacterized protein [Amphiura filiformis]|uniref:uncharacterized protein n=1 Tax=Amphiura filiformis TaxID=82378 RepID=UPI003B21C1C9